MSNELSRGPVRRPSVTHGDPDDEPECAEDRDGQEGDMPGHRRLKHPYLGQLGGECADLMHAQVVGMPVAAGGVVTKQQVGLLRAEQRDQQPGGLVEVGPREPGSPGRVGKQDRPAAAVGVAEVLGPGRAQDRGRAAELGQPDAVGFPHRAVAGDDDHDPVPLGGQPGQRAPGQDHLIIGVSMKRHDGRHQMPP
ncbi:MAG TPA: hypothetical protein VMU95_05875 [Trebonia sp.]|nr:hypothetical protein [Trebonia sp.]